MNKDKSRIAETPEEDPRGDSQIMGVALGDPEESDLFTETEDGYELDATPNDELRELAKRWENDAEYPTVVILTVKLSPTLNAFPTVDLARLLRVIGYRFLTTAPTVVTRPFWQPGEDTTRFFLKFTHAALSRFSRVVKSHRYHRDSRPGL